MTKILKCTCQNTWQDKEYGRSMRVMNKTQKGNSTDSATYRCTVCGSEKKG